MMGAKFGYSKPKPPSDGDSMTDPNSVSAAVDAMLDRLTEIDAEIMGHSAAIDDLSTQAADVKTAMRVLAALPPEGMMDWQPITRICNAPGSDLATPLQRLDEQEP